MTTYITITMVIFLLGIFTITQDDNQYNVYAWISTIFLHLVIPISMIISYILTVGTFEYNLKQHYKLALRLILIYPVCFLL